MIEFEPTWRPAMHVIGLEVRTTTAREADAATAQIPSLWTRFDAEGVAARVPQVVDATVLYAVRTCYAPDGEFSFILGVSVDERAVAPDGLTKALLPPGSYFVATSYGEPRAAADAAWRAAADYFAAPDAPARSFTADIEVHRQDAPREVELYIAVQ